MGSEMCIRDSLSPPLPSPSLPSPPPPLPSPPFPSSHARLDPCLSCLPRASPDVYTCVCLPSYHKAAVRYHPDKYVAKNDADAAAADAKFKEIARAYEVLGDEELRRKYDLGEVRARRMSAFASVCARQCLRSPVSALASVCARQCLRSSRCLRLLLRTGRTGRASARGELAGPRTFHVRALARRRTAARFCVARTPSPHPTPPPSPPPHPDCMPRVSAAPCVHAKAGPLSFHPRTARAACPFSAFSRARPSPPPNARYACRTRMTNRGRGNRAVGATSGRCTTADSGYTSTLASGERRAEACNDVRSWG